MAASAEEAGDLLVFEYGGEARSGKGTIVDCLSGEPGVAKEETGIDYRFLTHVLLRQGKLNAAMSPADISASLANMTFDELVSILAHRDSTILSDDRQALYEDDVNQLVPDVAQLKDARKAVKTGFSKRIETIRDLQKYRAVAIDGRNLSEVIRAIPGAHMALRTFVKCSPVEAALRECTRENIDPISPEGQRKLDSIRTRNEKDGNRQEDPMRADADAVDYWQDSDLGTMAHQLSQAGSTAEYLAQISDRRGSFETQSLPQGIGRAAALSSRQVIFDTTVFRLFKDPKAAMLLAAEQMFKEALAANS